MQPKSDVSDAPSSAEGVAEVKLDLASVTLALKAEAEALAAWLKRNPDQADIAEPSTR